MREFICPHCKRVAIVKATPEQATYFGGCRHVEQIELKNGEIQVIYDK